jgi:hypothetical protein
MISVYESAPKSQPHGAGSMDDVRELVTATLNDLGLGNAKPLGERLICCERFYVGVRIAFEGVSAIWLSEAGHVRFVDDSGKPLRSVERNCCFRGC